MQVRTQQGDVLNTPTPLAALMVWQDDDLPTEVVPLLEADDFQGKAGQAALLYPRAALACTRLLLLGLGERGQTNLDSLRQAAARAAQRAAELRLPALACALPTLPDTPPAQVVQALVEGADLGTYSYLQQKSSLTPDEEHQLDDLLVMSLDTSADSMQQAAQAGAAIAQGVRFARDLANGPGNVLTPTRMAEEALALQTHFPNLKVTVLSTDALTEQGFGGLLAVSQGSAQPPAFVILEHGQPGDDRPTICLVGKGVTFDTGGISIKPAASMDMMKMDMGGAAAVLGTMRAISALNLPLHIVGLVGATENMPGANAYKPGDVITTLSGKTVEVLNTDAEGRIVLADALFYAQRYQPQAVIDVATLTGAMVISLGAHATGMMSNDDALAARLTAAGEATAERVWRLPLWEAYGEQMKSQVADVKNVAGRSGGALTAAGFLHNFVGDHPWAHLDIAGTAWVEDVPKAYQTKGATGVGVRLLTDMLRTWATPE